MSWKRLSPSVQAWSHQEESGREEWWEWLSRVYLSPADGGIYVQTHRQRGEESEAIIVLCFNMKAQFLSVYLAVYMHISMHTHIYAYSVLSLWGLAACWNWDHGAMQQTWLHWLPHSALFTNTGLGNWPIIYIFIIIYHKSFESLVLSFGFACHCWNFTTTVISSIFCPLSALLGLSSLTSSAV